MAIENDTTSTKPKRGRSSKPTPSMPPSSGPDSATLQTIQSLQRQIADLEAKEEERGALTKAQAAELEALKAEIAELKKPKTPEPTAGNTPSEPAGRLAPWCPW